MVLNEKIKNNIKMKLQKELVLYSGDVIKTGLLKKLFLGSLLVSIPSLLNMEQGIYPPPEPTIFSKTLMQLTQFIPSQFIQILIILTFLLGVFFMFNAIRLIYSMTNYEIKLNKKDLIYYIAISDEIDNKLLNNFIIEEFKNINNEALKEIKKTSTDKKFLENLEKFESISRSKEEVKITKLKEDKVRINKEIRRIEKIIGKRIKNIHISNT